MEDNWEQLFPLLTPAVRSGINEFGFDKMTPVQATCIPLLLGHKDIAVEAVTGSGKTLAFLVPTLQIILRREEGLRKHQIYALIVSPTRELATQIHEVLQVLLRYSPSVNSLLLVGGSNINDDMKRFRMRGGHIVIGTPGRIKDVFDRTGKDGFSMALGCKALEVLILDEADKLLELGFNDTVNTILAYLPKQRRTGLFSATQTSSVVNLIRAGLRNPHQVKVRQNNATLMNMRTPASLQNFYMLCKIEEKLPILISLLKERKEEKVLVFFSSCAAVDYFFLVLKHVLKTTSILGIHGKMKQKRFKIFDQFRSWKNGVLVCTDVMCRGVDIPQVDWVIQFDPPSSAESFVHRCGRTARSGNVGSALLMLLRDEEQYVKFLELNQNVKLKQLSMPDFNALPSFTTLLNRMRKLQVSDRSVMDKANRAFVSFVKFYQMHECNVLFKLKNLNLGKLAMSYGLLSMLKMPELKNMCTNDFVPYDIDLNSVPYKNKEKEKSRQTKLNVFHQTGKWPVKNDKNLKKQKQQTISWSKKKEAKQKKKNKNQQKRQQEFTLADLLELENDEKMLRKIKKRKLSQKEVDDYFGCGSDE